MLLDGGFADIQPFRDLRVDKAVNGKLQHLRFPPRKPVFPNERAQHFLIVSHGGQYILFRPIHLRILTLRLLRLRGQKGRRMRARIKDMHIAQPLKHKGNKRESERNTTERSNEHSRAA